MPMRATERGMAWGGDLLDRTRRSIERLGDRFGHARQDALRVDVADHAEPDGCAQEPDAQTMRRKRAQRVAPDAGAAPHHALHDGEMAQCVAARDAPPVGVGPRRAEPRVHAEQGRASTARAHAQLARQRLRLDARIDATERIGIVGVVEGVARHRPVEARPAARDLARDEGRDIVRVGDDTVGAEALEAPGKRCRAAGKKAVAVLEQCEEGRVSHPPVSARARHRGTV